LLTARLPGSWRRPASALGVAALLFAALLFAALLFAALLLATPRPLGGQANAPSPSVRPRVACDGDTVTSIDVRAHPPAVNGVAAEAWESTTQAAGLAHTVTRRDVIIAYLRVSAGRVCADRDISESERLLRAQPFVASASVRVVRDGVKHVRLQVDVVDELPVIIGGSLRDGTVSTALLGTLNLDGRGLAVQVNGERAFGYRTGVGARVVQYGAFGRPDYVAVAAARARLGDAASIELAEPFLTDLQVQAFHASAGEASDYYGVVRPIGDDLSLYTRRAAYDLGWVTRIAPSRRGGAIGLLGAALLGEDVRTGTGAVIVTDTGFVAEPASNLGTRYAATAAVRVAAIGGLRSLRFITVRGFDAIRARQDEGIGVQFDLLAGPSIWASRNASDVFVAGDFYAGAGDERAFFAARALFEASGNRDEKRWQRLVASSRLSWYGRPSETRTLIASVEMAALGRLSFPAQLTFRDEDGGVRGYGDAAWAGGQRIVARLEERRILPWFTRRADIAAAFFADAGKLWAGDAPYGTTTGVHASLGVSLLGAFPAGGKRTYRVDVGVPLAPEPGRGRFEVRLSSADRTSLLWKEPADLSRARTGAVPANLMKW
jgi:hypothetical protein